MQLHCVRFTVRRLMTFILVICVSLAVLIHQERFRRFKKRLANQAIAVEAAYASYQNAELAHENARSDAALYLEKIGKGVKSVNDELSSEEDPGDQAFKALKDANKKALASEWTRKEIWEKEKRELWRLIKELQDMW